MTAMAVPALLALIASRGCVPPAVAPVMVGIALNEGHGHLYPFAIHDNATGRGYVPDTEAAAVALASSLLAAGHDLDAGVAQVNVRNWHWTGLTLASAFDPCASIAAGSKVLFARYNGNPPDTAKAAYAAGVLSKFPIGSGFPAAPIAKAVDPPCAPGWDAWALAACSGRAGPSRSSHKTDGASSAIGFISKGESHED
jgi:type IV secretion system protein VirB1